MAGALSTPREHLGILVAPDPDKIHAALDAAAGRNDDAPILDTTVATLRAALRRELGWQPPVVIVGHQVEFFHAGVFAKTIAAHHLHQRHGGTGAFLVADSDVPKDHAIAVPHRAGAALERRLVALPPLAFDRPAEFQPRHPCHAWAAAFDELRAAVPWIEQTPFDTFAGAWQARCGPDATFTDNMQAARTAVEAALGLGDLAQVRMLTLARTPAFRAYLAHYILHARAAADAYNAAQAAYRRRHKLRNPHRPVEPLQVDGERVELPFWVVHPEQPRRRLFATPGADVIRLDADGQALAALAPAALSSSRNLETPWPFEAAGYTIRPRALMLSSFVRLFVADLFVHGIGGARYDEVTDDLIRRFLGIELPPIACVTATAHLPIAAPDVDAAAVQAARITLRDMHYNPQRHFANLPAKLLDQRESLILRSDGMRGSGPRYHTIRKAIFHEIRELNARLVASRTAEIEGQKQTITQREHAARQAAVARDREYFFALQPRETLQALIAKLGAALR
jgi:hypothetical protein